MEITKLKEITGPGEFRVLVRVTSMEIRKTKNGQRFLSGELSDSTRTLPAKVWGDVASRVVGDEKMAVGSILRANVTSSIYNGALQVTVDSIGELTADEVTEEIMREVGASAPKTQAWLLGKVEELTNEAYSLDDSYPNYEGFTGMLKDIGIARAFITVPAAKQMHHAYRLGLLQHSVEVALLAKGIAEAAGQDVALAIYGGLLHDIGKTKTYELGSAGEITMTLAGTLFEHLVEGAVLIRGEMHEYFAPSAMLKLAHIALSHHKLKEHGSPVQPAFAEALTVHVADYISSNKVHYDDALVSPDLGQRAIKKFGLDNAYVLSGTGMAELNGEEV